MYNHTKLRPSYGLVLAMTLISLLDVMMVVAGCSLQWYPKGLQTSMGSASPVALTALQVQDQQANQDQWNKYVEFYGSRAAYKGVFTFDLTGANVTSVQSYQLDVNFKGPTYAVQQWTLEYLVAADNQWFLAGNNKDANNWYWTPLSFQGTKVFSSLVGSDGKLQLRLTSSKGDDCDLDYLAITTIDHESPTSIPSMPSSAPTANPTTTPTVNPTTTPSLAPTTPPTQRPTSPPTQRPTSPPTQRPTSPPTQRPTSTPTTPATAAPTTPPTQRPTTPTQRPTSTPTPPATAAPTIPPTQRPTAPATVAPTTPPTQKPTAPTTVAPTTPPTQKPTAPATVAPTPTPTQKPTTPTQKPTTPTQKPTTPATVAPTTPATAAPSNPSQGTGGRLCPAGQVWAPAPGTTWQWQLTGTIDQSWDVQMYDIDLFDVSTTVIHSLHSKGRAVICYFSTQYEDWRPDASKFTSGVLGNALDDWPGERFVDIRSSKLRQIMAERLDLAVSKGCDGVEPDNVDGYANSNGLGLTAANQLDYNKFLAQEAHKRGLSIGLKNDLDQVAALVSHFDWALNEQCNQYKECNYLTPFVTAGKAVFGVDYSGTAANICPTMVTSKFSWLMKELSLGAKGTQCCSYAANGCAKASYRCITY